MRGGRRRIRSCMKYLRKNKFKPASVYGAAAALLLVSAATGLLFGASGFRIPDLAEAVRGVNSGSPEANIFWFVRLPRVAAGLLCGAALSVSGVVIQGVLANRLASPSIIGVNSGAGLAVTLCTAMGIAGGWRLSMSAFLGAFAAVAAVSLGAKKWGASRGTVILMGVAMNSLLEAASDVVTIFAPEVGVMRSGFRIGDFSSATYVRLVPAAVVIAAALLLLCTLANELDVLTLGEEGARGLGMNTGVMRMLFLLLAAALAGAAVSVAGLLSFVGLLVPHAVRRAATGEARHLIPLSALFGAGFVTLCDTLSRVVFAPYELPVGIFLAFLGAPFFLFILIRGKGGHGYA